MTSQQQALQHLDFIFKQHKLKYCVIGGFALIFYGSERPTLDIDITLLVEFHEIRKTGGIILQYFQPRKENPIDFFEQYFVLPVIHSESQTLIDISAGVSGFDHDVVHRSQRKNIDGVEINIASIEDLIIYKIIADRARDREDVERLFQLHAQDLDYKYLQKQADAFREIERSDVREKLEIYKKRFL